LGGHDHLYYASKGVTSWEDFDVTEQVLGAEDDGGDVLVVKSGTDWRDLSELVLEFESTPQGSVRRKVIKRITGENFSAPKAAAYAFLDSMRMSAGKRHTIKPGSKSSENLTVLLKTLLSSVSSTLMAPVCKTDVAIDVRSQFIRTAEVSVYRFDICYS
jgi:hypothetical protein